MYPYTEFSLNENSDEKTLLIISISESPFDLSMLMLSEACPISAF